MKPVELVQAVIVPFASAALGGWLTARFALGRFYREKVWERKTEAYSAIFAALHDMGEWYDAHFDAEVNATKLSEERQLELAADYGKAKKELGRRLAAETWLMPAKCSARLRQMRKEMSDADNGRDWFRMIDGGGAAISSAVADLRKLVREDLKLGKE